MDKNQTSKPDKVRTAVKLLYISWGIGIFRQIIWAAIMYTPELSINFAILISFGLMLLLIYLIDKGRNWARIIFLVLFIIVLPFSILELPYIIKANRILGLLDIVQITIQAVSLVLLFQRPSSNWFKAKKTKK